MVHRSGRKIRITAPLPCTDVSLLGISQESKRGASGTALFLFQLDSGRGAGEVCPASHAISAPCLSIGSVRPTTCESRQTSEYTAPLLHSPSATRPCCVAEEDRRSHAGAAGSPCSFRAGPTRLLGVHAVSFLGKALGEMMSSCAVVCFSGVEIVKC